MYQLNDKIKDLKPYDPVTEDSRIHLDANESFLPLPAPILEELAAAVRELTEAGQSVRVQPGTEGTARCRRAMKMKNGRPVLLEADD